MPLARLAATLGVSPGDLAATLVSVGFFEVANDSVLRPVEARAAAAAFGRSVLEAADEPDVGEPDRAGVTGVRAPSTR